MDKCGNCKIWFDLEFKKQCPRMSVAVAKACGLVERLQKGTEAQAAKWKKQNPHGQMFSGVGIIDEPCNKYIRAEG